MNRKEIYDYNYVMCCPMDIYHIDNGNGYGIQYSHLQKVELEYIEKIMDKYDMYSEGCCYEYYKVQWYSEGWKYKPSEVDRFQVTLCARYIAELESQISEYADKGAVERIRVDKLNAIWFSVCELCHRI